MGRRKYTCLSFQEYETEAMAEYLEQMAAKGWMLNRMVMNSLFCFEKEPPQRLKFCVAVLPDSSEFASKNREEARLYREYCESAGWQLLYGGTLWQIFTSGEEALLPIETDLRLQLETQKAISLSRGRWAATLALCGFFLIAVYLLLKEPGKTLASTEVALTVVLALGAAAVFPGMMLSRLLWYRRAEQMLEKTGRLPPVSLRRVKIRNVASFVSAAAVFAIFLMRNDTWEGILICGQGLLSVVICSLVLSWIREHGTGNPKENAVGYFVGAIAICMIVISLFSNVLTRLSPKPETRETYVRLEPFPVGFQELGYEESEIWHKESRRSLLSFYQKETGRKQGTGSGMSALHMTYYKSPFPLIISRTRSYYPREKGNMWSIQKSERMREDGIRVTRYHYEQEEGSLLPYENRVQDTYLLSDRNRLLVLSFPEEVEEEAIEPAAALFAGAK